MVGAAKHCKKAIDVGMDIICAQGGEGGGHTGVNPTSLLVSNDDDDDTSICLVT